MRGAGGPPAGVGAPPPAAGDGQAGASAKKKYKLLEAFRLAIHEYDAAHRALLHAESMVMLTPHNDPISFQCAVNHATAQRRVTLAYLRMTRAENAIADALLKEDTQ